MDQKHIDQFLQALAFISITFPIHSNHHFQTYFEQTKNFQKHLNNFSNFSLAKNITCSIEHY